MNMTADRCKWMGSGRPRVLPGRHNDGCGDETCPGCLPCPMDHCRVCGVEHASGGCPNCREEVRDNLATLVRLCRNLPAEVEHRGVESEAMNLLGPAADPESWGHVEASVTCGRLPVEWQAADDERHPRFVLGTWEMVYRDAFDQQTDALVTIHDAADYLDRQLTRAAAEPWVPFEDFAKDLRACVGHIEAVLHDGEQVDRGAPCMKCGRALERTWGMDANKDGWKCTRCNTTSTEAQYRFAVAHLHREEATHLTDRDMQLRTGVKAGTVRVWARRGLVERRTDGGRVVYSVAQVEAEARQRGLLAS